MTTIRVDGIDYRVPEGRNLLHACLSLGLDLPYFCWHPAMDSVGACRQCAVKQYKDEEDDQGRIVMACMTPADDGARISIEDAEARDFRARVIEWLMVNHPHDCPVCDEGGECHLQDMTVMTGHNERRYRFEKRTHRNQDLGPFIEHEMNRCIACYRCVRFYRDYAGGRDLHALGSHHNVYFGRHEDGPLESEFSGNLVEVCPTGVFTDKTLKRHYTRKWDLQSAPSVCVHCGLGCNTLASERYGGVRRILNRYNHEVNGYFLCDRGRFGYEFANRDDRVRAVLVRDGEGGALRQAREGEPAQRLRSLLGNGARVWGIGSPRASLEANFALRTLVGEERFSTGLAAPEQELARLAVSLLRRGPLPTPSLEGIRRSDAVLVLGEDPSDTAPVLALALRQAARQGPLSIARELGIPEWHDAAVREAVQDRTGPFYVAAPAATRLDDVATETLRAGPDRIARLGAAVARALDSGAPAPSEGGGEADEELHALAGRIAEGLRGAERPVVVSGTGSGSRAVMEAAANVATALAKVHAGEPSGLALTVPECNTLGTALLGGRSLEVVIDAVEAGEVDTVVVLENDLERRLDAGRLRPLWDRRGEAPDLVVIDHLHHATAERADLMLPAATFAEGDGTFVSSEGRAQRAFQVHVPDGAVRESWRWLAEAAEAAGRGAELPWTRLDEVIEALAASDPVLAPAAEAAPDADFRRSGARVARSPARFSGRTAMNADRTVHEPKPPEDPDAPLSFSMEGTRSRPPAALTPYYWAPGWNSVQSVNKFQQEVAGPSRGGDPGRRLLEPGDGGAPVPYFEIGESFAGGEDDPERWTIVPLHHVFGSEELSAQAPAVAERSPDPYLAVERQGALEAGWSDGELAELELPDGAVRLPVRLRDDLPAGVAGLPVGLPGVPYRRLPAAGRLRRVEGGAETGADHRPGKEDAP